MIQDNTAMEFVCSLMIEIRTIEQINKLLLLHAKIERLW